ncbi:MAG: Holliday junction resolvase RuvX [Zoogloeaceae bacterium]|jgi:putative Holliday junction resolvase|nr:Holliday junction resolvase RuvX [Zoogloeaceae bacterium]
MGTVLAFDFGEKRTGVAVGETALRQAHPLTVLKVSDNARLLEAVARLIVEWRPEQLVVGLPTYTDGTPHDMTQRARAFAAHLRERFALPVAEADEVLTSLDAESRLRETGHNAKTMKPVIDAVAAQLILQTWFDFPHDCSETSHHDHIHSSSLPAA